MSRNERLKSRKLISRLFSEGKAISSPPLRIIYLVSPQSPDPVQAGFSVSSRNFKNASDRNRIKRLLRECYRTQKHSLLTFVENRTLRLSVFFIYAGKEMPEYPLIKERTADAIMHLIKRLEPRNE